MAPARATPGWGEAEPVWASLTSAYFAEVEEFKASHPPPPLDVAGEGSVVLALAGERKDGVSEPAAEDSMGMLVGTIVASVDLLCTTVASSRFMTEETYESVVALGKCISTLDGEASRGYVSEETLLCLTDGLLKVPSLTGATPPLPTSTALSRGRGLAVPGATLEKRRMMKLLTDVQEIYVRVGPPAMTRLFAGSTFSLDVVEPLVRGEPDPWGFCDSAFEEQLLAFYKAHLGDDVVVSAGDAVLRDKSTCAKFKRLALHCKQIVVGAEEALSDVLTAEVQKVLLGFGQEIVLLQLGSERNIITSGMVKNVAAGLVQIPPLLPHKKPQLLKRVPSPFTAAPPLAPTEDELLLYFGKLHTNLNAIIYQVSRNLLGNLPPKELTEDAK